MAQRAKGRWRGRTYTRKSLRPGKRTIHVRGYCRRGATATWKKAAQQVKDWGF